MIRKLIKKLLTPIVLEVVKEKSIDTCLIKQINDRLKVSTTHL